METLTAYFQPLFAQCKLDGTLKRAKVNQLWNHAKRTLASNLRKKREARRTRHAHHESHKCGRYDGHRSYRRGTDNRRSHKGGGDWDATDATEAITSQNVETAVVEVTVQTSNDFGKKSWSKCDERQHDDKKDQHDDRDHRKKIEAHHLNNRFTSSEHESPDDDQNTNLDRGRLMASSTPIIILPWRLGHLQKKQTLNVTLLLLRRRRLRRVSARLSFLAKKQKSC